MGGMAMGTGEMYPGVPRRGTGIAAEGAMATGTGTAPD